MIKIKGLNKTLRGEPLLNNINFTIGNGEKIALIGPNGCGKSTLLKMILGLEEVDSGHIILEKERLGYLPQELSFEGFTSVESYYRSLLPQETEQHRLEKIISQLALVNVSPHQPIEGLSEGQKMKLKLLEVLIAEPTMLLLDEPTNHLDIDGILWFEKFIKSYPGAVLMISHDRSFIDHTATHIFEIDEHSLHIFPGNYTTYVEQKEGWIEHRDRDFHAQERKRKKLEELLEHARQLKDGKARGKAIRAAEKRMEREVLRNEVKEYERYGIDGIDFKGETHRDKLILRVASLSHRFGDREILQELNFEIRGTERVWLFGHNGVGKSTLLNIITQHLTPTHGAVTLGANVRWGYFQQNQKHLPNEVKLVDYLRKELGLQEFGALSWLERLNFTKDHLHRKLGQLSPGERARLTIAVFTTQEFDFLILDEPTNHLDIWTKEAIEQALQEYRGAILLVSHDRYFVKQVGVDKIMNLNERRLKFI